ncbi:MAG TPA: ornithine carbamoyltransferase [Actinomycetota bacterium]|nr:ornithine carbamoyltransferase [Actinomycetota bacterium]
MPRNFLSIDDLSPAELAGLLELSAKVKASPEDYAGRLAGLAVAMILEKPSTRTRVSFEVGLVQLGAHPLALSGSELQLGRGETIEDTGRVLSRYVDAVVVRTFGQERLEGLARTSTVPIVNALSDFEHPCQCLADLLTVREKKGDLVGLVLAYVGDGNNVTHSLLLGGAKAGMEVRVATPPGYEPIPQVVERAREIGAETGGRAMVTNDPVEATTGADVLYTDVWASMGQEAEANERILVFQSYRLDRAALERAAPDAIVLHCLPAHRGHEITDEVIDGPHSVVWDQAENRLHTQKALLLRLLGRN